MKKISLLTFIMLLPLIALADAVEIDGIYYNLIEKGKVAEVTSNPNKYTGDITIPEKVTYNEVEYRVTSIGNKAFEFCFNLISVFIPNSVTTIGSAAFNYCNSLTTVTIPKSVTTIGSGAFYQCSNLTSVTIPSSVTTIGEHAFGGCSGLTSVHIYDMSAWCYILFENSDSNPLSYAHHLYMNGQEITDLIIPNTVTSISSYAFYYCSSLTSVSIPNSVTTIGSGTFLGCKGLSSIAIPNSVTTIGSGAFQGCKGLTSIYIPSSLKNMDDNAFCDCSGLISVTIPNNMKTIGSGAFRGCSSLTSIIVPNSVTSIGQTAFYGCSSLTSITIGSGIKNLSINAFASCKELTDVYCYAENVPSTSTDAFKDSYIEYATLHVPATSVNAYKSAEPWKNFKSIVAIDGEIPATQKCTMPTISYNNKKLTFSCETEGAEFVSEIKDADVKKYYDSNVNLDATYEISVYATKSGYDNSDVATATLVWTNATFTTNSTSSAKEMNLRPLLIQANSGNINIQGAEDGTRIAVYNVNGQQIGSAVSAFNTTDVSTPLKKGDVAIVKVGQRSVK